jgi:hypothetical protein
MSFPCPSAGFSASTCSVMTVVLAMLGMACLAMAQDSALTPPAGAPRAPVVILKLDDLVASGSNSKVAVSPRWQKLADYLETTKTPASIGVICESLQADRPAYIAWIAARQATGLYEFWNHGWLVDFPADKATGRIGAFQGTTLDEQLGFLRQGQQAMLAKTGITMRAFGPHVCKVDATTYAALEQIPELTMVWYYGPPRDIPTTKFVFKRTINLEKPLFRPNLAHVQERFAGEGSRLDYVAMQGHPGQWSDADFAQFTQVIDYLREQGCSFATPSAYRAAAGR